MDFTPNPSFARTFAHSPGVRDTVQDVVWDIHDIFQATAARDTGAMAASARPILTRGPDGWHATYEVPVENDHGTKYAKFVEFGTRYMRAQHTLRNALEELQARNT